MNQYVLGLALVGFVVGFGLAFIIKGLLDKQKVKAAHSDAAQIIQEARHKADALLKEANLEAKDRLLKMKNEFDNETRETRAELKKQEANFFFID